MENLLKAQQSLESVQTMLVHHVPVETIEAVHTQLMSGIKPTTSPQAQYLLTIGHLNVGPTLRSLSDFPPANTHHAAHTKSGRPSHARTKSAD